MSTNDVSRRRFMRVAGGATVGASMASQSGAAQDGNESGGGNESDGGGGGGGDGGNQVPDFGSYLGSANLYEPAATQDARGEDAVTISVGGGDGLAFDPAAVWVSPGTTITWEWTGEGGTHNVVNNDGPADLDSGSAVDEAGYTYEFEVTEADAGVTTYKCVPHEAQGMRGGVAVGDDVPTQQLETDSGGPAITIPDQALSLTTATFVAMASTLGLGYFLMKFGGDYEQEQ